jgi:hypothetical protein
MLWYSLPPPPFFLFYTGPSIVCLFDINLNFISSWSARLDIEGTQYWKDQAFNRAFFTGTPQPFRHLSLYRLLTAFYEWFWMVGHHSLLRHG